MPRVLHVISGIDPQNGGPTVALLGMVKSQREAGIEASIFSTWRQPGADVNAETFRAAGVPIEMVGRAIGKLSWHPALRRKITAAVKSADIVHVHGVWEEAQYQALRAARRLRKPVVFTPHGMLATWNMGRNPLFKRLYLRLRLRRLLDQVARIHFTTEAEQQSTAPLGLRPPAIIERLGVDLSEFDPLPEHGRFRARFPQLRDRKIVLFLGRIDYKKGLDLLLPAFAAATADSPESAGAPCLVLAGPDNDGYGHTLQALARKLGITDRVLFTGMLHGRERIEALVDADLFALTSYVENFGVAVIESLAAGLPVVISDQVNLADSLRETGVGEIVPLDAPRITAALTAWLRDAERRRAASLAARRQAQSVFNWPTVARRWVAHYGALMPSVPATVGKTAQAHDPGVA